APISRTAARISSRSRSQLPKTKCVWAGKRRTVAASSMSPQCRMSSAPARLTSWRACCTRSPRPWVSLTMAMRMAHPALPRRVGAPGDGLDQRLDEEVIAPGDRLVHAEALVQVIDAVQQDAFPARPAL